jgi:hypothetical protein
LDRPAEQPGGHPNQLPSAADEDEDGFDTDGVSKLEMLMIFSMYGTYEPIRV